MAVQVKKVKAFPIAAKMTIGQGPEAIKAQILKLNARGFLVEAQVPAMKTGDKFTIAFELPVLHSTVTEACVAVKMYVSSNSQVVEGHFQSIQHKHEQNILRFLAGIPKASS